MGRPVILHADLDCFYAQVEALRLKLPDDQPMAVQQWSNVIAVNYPARAKGVSRHSSIAECLQACPEMVFVHVPTYSVLKPGEVFRYPAKGATKEQPVPAGADRAEHKASLSPYRKASRAIFGVFERFATVLEKAGLDEAFMDVSKMVDEEFVKEFGEDLSEEAAEEFWKKLDWSQLGVPAVPLDSVSSRPSSYIDELRLCSGARLALKIRHALRDELGYTCSIGVAHNKMLAKLGSARNKPFNQTFILDRMTVAMMKDVPLKKIRFLGGKFGALLSQQASNSSEDEQAEDDQLDLSDDEDEQTDTKVVLASDLWPLTVSELSYRLGGDMESARWAHQIIRGVDNAAVTPRSKPKSFMAAKTMRPALREWSQVDRWLRLLTLELWERLEEDYEINVRWPKTITLYHKTYNQEAKNQSTEFPVFSPDLFSVDLVVGHLGKLLLASPTNIFPLGRLFISVSRFAPIQKDLDGKRWSTLDKFVSADKKPSFDAIKPMTEMQKRPPVVVEKKRPGGIGLFFKPKVPVKEQKAEPSDTSEDNWRCPDCEASYSMFEIDQIQEHQDYHIALKLQ